MFLCRDACFSGAVIPKPDYTGNLKSHLILSVERMKIFMHQCDNRCTKL